MTELSAVLPPLAVHFVWHPNNKSTIFPFINEFRRYLTRNLDRPFSRELNIPTFLYSTNNGKNVPQSTPQKLAQKNVIFLFLSTDTLISKVWINYINSISQSINEKMFIVPVAIEQDALKHGSNGILENYNFVRAFEWSTDLYFEQGTVTLSHELYRFGIKTPSKKQQGINSSIKIFLSHAKKGDTGLNHAKAIKQYIDCSNMQNFFDTYDISPGFRFDEEIEKHIENSTVIAISSDSYSSRYWCQREILYAKKHQRPIIAVNSLENFEDRIFPAAANIPCVHLVSDVSITKKDILRILISTILETIRFEHAKLLLEFYQQKGWIDEKAHLFSRPPEIQQIVELRKGLANDSSYNENTNLIICYPEPPLYKEETDWTDYFNITVSTPLWMSSDAEESSRQNIGLSISDYIDDDFSQQYLHVDELKRFSQVLTRHLLARGKKLIYAGDLRDDGFTEFILDEAAVVRDRLQIKELHIENHLAWPLYLIKNNKLWQAKYFGLLESIEHPLPSDVEELVDNKHPLEPNTPENKYIWSRSLTQTRIESIKNSDVRIFAGGKTNQYMGKMPGILEEFLIAFEENKPIYLVGGLGGITTMLCQSILEKNIANELTEYWQITNNSGYKQLQDIAKRHSQDANYTDIGKKINSIHVSDLAKVAGLSEEEYTRLMQTYFIDECVHLILKGLKSIK
ncbi:TIR domain-containing protein [Orbus wheelerorum]|uniref:TIR domain-containing protein n=1 Tax=Orbus wheelerorum TaxID=3074111 RepID=UPI00370D22A1